MKIKLFLGAGWLILRAGRGEVVGRFLHFVTPQFPPIPVDIGHRNFDHVRGGSPDASAIAPLGVNESA